MLEEGLDVVAFKEIDLPKKAVQIWKFEYFYAE
jgi:hypothetical protein